MPIQDSQFVQSFIFKLKLENNSKAIDLLYCLFEMEIQESICSLWPVHSGNNERMIVVVCRGRLYGLACSNIDSPISELLRKQVK